MVENAESIWVEKVGHGDDVRRRTLNHCGLEAGVVAVFHDVEARVGGTHRGNRLGDR